MAKANERILTTASRLFREQGYNSTGINQIIEEAKVAKGSFYYNFKSKEDLCIAFLNQRHDYWFEALRSFVESRSEQGILSSFLFLMHMNEQENFQGCSFLNILSEIPPENTRILDVLQAHKNDVRMYLADLLEDKEQADHVYLLFEGAIIESQLFKQQWPVLRAKSIVESIIK